MEMSFTRPTLTIERHQPATQVNQTHLSQRITLNVNPLQDSVCGGCDPLKQPNSHLGLLHTTPEALEMIHLVLMTFWTNLNEQMIRDIV